MNINPQDIQKIADLVKLKLSNKETKKFAQELEVILKYISQLKEIDTQNIKPTYQIPDLTNVLREDKIDNSTIEKRKKLINSFPQSTDNYLITPSF